jgi:hypothetical protein
MISNITLVGCQAFKNNFCKLITIHTGTYMYCGGTTLSRNLCKDQKRSSQIGNFDSS